MNNICDLACIRDYPDGECLARCGACYRTIVLPKPNIHTFRCAQPLTAPPGVTRNVEAALVAAHAHQPKLLGEAIHEALGSIGITPERYRRFKEKCGLPPECNCENRKEWLNKLDREFGLGEKLNKALAAFGWRG